MERRTRNAVAGFVVLVLTGLLASACLPTEVDYDCTAVRTDTLDAFAQGDTLTGDLHCQKQ